MSGPAGKATEIAPGVYVLAVGKGFMRANVYFVRSGPSWVLVDAGSPGCAAPIREAAESLFGVGLAPVSILITHDHPDHVGAVRELIKVWGCPAYAHPDEMVMVRGDMATFREYGHPLDRWVVLPMLRLMGKKRGGAIMSKAGVADLVQAFDPAAAPPGLPDWEAVLSPGHTPGHVAFFRRSDRVLISGDALLTMKFTSPVGFLTERQTVSGPPWYVTWDRRAARVAVTGLAKLEPLVLAGGHGIPMSGPEMSEQLRALAALRH